MLLALFSQFYLRRYCATWFRKYNYLVSAALDGGTQFFGVIAVRDSPSLRLQLLQKSNTERVCADVLGFFLPRLSHFSVQPAPRRRCRTGLSTQPETTTTACVVRLLLAMNTAT